MCLKSLACVWNHLLSLEYENEDQCFLCIHKLLNSPILVAAAKSQEELTGEMEGSPDDQIYVGQKGQDMKEGKQEAGERDLLKETSFTESELKTSFTESTLKEKKDGCRNPFSNVPFPSTKNKGLSKVVNV